MTSRIEPTQARKAIDRQFSATSVVRQLSSSSWSSFKSALSRNSCGNNKHSAQVEVSVENVRSLVMAQVKDNSEWYHENDIVKVKTNQWFVDRFIKEGDSKIIQDPGVIASSITECLKWRKEIRINEMKATNFPKEFYDTALFAMGPLTDGNVMLYLTGRRFKRIDGFTDLWIEFFLYCYESQYESFKDGTKLMVLLDVSGVGLSGVDLPLFFKLITIVLKYYPSLVTKFFILDMPWILKPIAKVVFAILPKKYVDMVGFVWKRDLKENMGLDKLPDFMGGQVETYRIPPPPNCNSLEDIAARKGISGGQIKKAKKILDEITKQMEKEKMEAAHRKS